MTTPSNYAVLSPDNTVENLIVADPTFVQETGISAVPYTTFVDIGYTYDPVAKTFSPPVPS